MGKDMGPENTAGTAITDNAENSGETNNAMGGQRPTNIPNDKAAVAGGETATGTTDVAYVTNETPTMLNNENVNANNTAAATVDMSSLILIGISGLALGGGILVTKIYKR